MCTYLAIPKKKGPKGKRAIKDGAKEGKRVKRLRVIRGNPKVHIPAPEIDQNNGVECNLRQKMALLSRSIASTLLLL
jgi:hypothetical protein